MEVAPQTPNEPHADRRIRVLLLLWSLQGGGAERTALHLLNRLDKNRFDVKMGLIRRGGAYLEQADPSRIITGKIKSDLFNVEDGANREIFTIKNILQLSAAAPLQTYWMLKDFRPHVALSFCKGMNITTLAGAWLYGRRKFSWIAREGNNVATVIDHELENPFLRRSLRFLTKKTYRSASRFLTISEDQASAARTYFNFSKEHTATIANGVDIETIESKCQEGDDFPARPFILGVGRLDEQKGFDVFLEAYAQSRIAKRCDLVLVGVGPEEQHLKNQAARLNITEKVHFVGWKANPWSWMSRAEAFVLSSRWEGFGNVVIEALACGAPTIVTDCDFGPREIVEHEVSGLIAKVGDVPSLAQKLNRLEDSPNLRKELAFQGKNRARDFSVSTIVKQYESLLEEESRQFVSS